MYRAVTWYALEHGFTGDAQQAIAALNATTIDCGVRDNESTITIGGNDPVPYLLSQQVNANVSAISAIPEVRRLLLGLQRAYADNQDVVMEGRDIGSAVFPETPYKFYIDASSEVRAQRRQRQGLEDAIAQRDRMDSSRRTSPLVIAEDAHVVDSSHLTIDGVVGEIIGRLKLKGLPLPENC